MWCPHTSVPQWLSLPIPLPLPAPETHKHTHAHTYSTTSLFIIEINREIGPKETCQGDQAYIPPTKLESHSGLLAPLSCQGSCLVFMCHLLNAEALKVLISDNLRADITQAPLWVKKHRKHNDLPSVTQQLWGRDLDLLIPSPWLALIRNLLGLGLALALQK